MVTKILSFILLSVKQHKKNLVCMSSSQKKTVIDRFQARFLISVRHYTCHIYQYSKCVYITFQIFFNKSWKYKVTPRGQSCCSGSPQQTAPHRCFQHKITSIPTVVQTVILNSLCVERDRTHDSLKLYKFSMFMFVLRYKKHFMNKTAYSTIWF